MRLALVDGFAGGGLYVDEATRTEHVGSPLIMLEAMAAAQVEAQAERRKPFALDVQYVFVEKSQSNTTFLRHSLRDRGFTPRMDSSIRIIQGSFEDEADRIIESIRTAGTRVHRAIFVLDQYGYADVPFPVLRRIFERLPQAEILLTFATDYILGYLADRNESHAALTRMSGDPAFAKRVIDLRDEPDGRRLIQTLLHERIHRSSGASFYTPFFITSRESNRSFWLLHLSPHARARDVMTRLHWELHNHFAHYGGPGLDMLGYDPKRPDAGTQVAFSFDANARERTTVALCEQLPKRIWNFRDGIPVGELYAHIANETPADSALMGEVLGKLAAEREINVTGPKGGRTRSQEGFTDHHIVVPTSQVPILFRK
jgi:three-Cys-motif partner protein